MRPTMTPEEAERIIGVPRGQLPAKFLPTEQYRALRKWLSAQGLPSSYVAHMKVAPMVQCYNDVTGAALRDQIAIATNSNSTNTETDLDSGECPKDESPVVVHPTLMPTPNPAATGDAGQVLAALVGPYLAAAVEQQVMKRVDAALAKVQIIRIEAVRDDGTTRTIEGHQHAEFANLLRACMSRMPNGYHPNIMLCGPTGSGKTHAAEQIAKAMGLEFRTNGAVSMDHQLVGYMDAHGNYHETPLRQAYGEPALWLQDEIDACDNSPLLALAGLMANGSHQFPDGIIRRHIDSLMLAAANTWGLGATNDFVGRGKLDGAILSRFPVRFFWDYDETLETAICGNQDWSRRVQSARAKARKAGLKVIIDPRMSMAGAALIAQGMTSEQAAKYTYLANLTAEQRAIVDA